MSRNIFKYSAVVASMLATAMFAGCGTDNKETATSAADVAKVDEATCAQCHGSSYNSQSGMPIYSEYVKSKHFKNALGEVVGCQDCHGGGAQHNGVGPIPYANPDSAGKCWGCHKPYLNTAHFQNITSYRVQYINETSADTTTCTRCHEPHDPGTGLGAAERKAWAGSGHGDVAGAAWKPGSSHKWLTTGSTNNFLTQNGTGACVRCHTADGFAQFVDSGYTNVNSVAGDPKANSPLKCRACHLNDSFSLRKAGQFTARYNAGNTSVKFPNVSKSNLCVACHSARENAASIEAVADFTNAGFVNSHYLGGAAIMYMASGFWNYTSSAQAIGSSTRQKTMTPDNTSVPTYGVSGGVPSTHRKLGTTLINGDSHNPAFFVSGTADDGGPCVTCHLNVNGTTPRAAHGHSWKIDVNAAQQICIQCHDGEVDKTTPGTASTADLNLFLEEQATSFTDALDLIKSQFLTNYGIKYDPNTYPYFYDMTKDPTGKTAVKDWTRGTNDQVFGKRLMGSAFNLNLLTKDPGSYVHGRTYVRRLVYDTIDYLDNKTLDYSAGATAKAYNPVLYGQGAKAYTTSATVGDVAPGTTADMLYLLGYNRSTGAWSTPERP